MKLSSKAISSIVSISLLLVIAVFSTIGFQNWNTNFNSQIFLDIETKNQNSQIKIEGIINDNLYIKSQNSDFIDILKLQDDFGNICDLSSSKIKNMSLNIPLDKVENGLVKDNSIYENHGIIQNNLICGMPGILDTSCEFRFNGNQTYINLNNVNINQGSNQKNTISFWMYANSETYGTMPFGSNTYDLYFSYYSPNYYFGFNTGAADIYGFNFSKKIDSWVYVTAIFNNGDINQNQLYINGINQSLNRVVGSSHHNRNLATTMKLGTWNDASGYFFRGFLDDFKLYSKELNKTQINILYNSYLRKGINKFEISTCNFKKDKKVSIFILTKKSNKVESVNIYR